MRLVVAVVLSFICGTFFALVVSQQYAKRYFYDNVMSMYGHEVVKTVQADKAGDILSAYEYSTAAFETLTLYRSGGATASEWEILSPMVYLFLQPLESDRRTLEGTQDRLLGRIEGERARYAKLMGLNR